MNLTTYLKETRNELRHVNWPTRKQTIAFTLIVIILSIVTAALLGGFDYIYTSIIKFII
ncbi:MAG: preprotein translocase subunit SecE [Candidatus Vogelbacteria bacterium GWA1_51_14]|uniref:Protein translocase subunit SecE n=1 Tax=Candidatus Vogelbacteria bacterium GWA1_51_14 TaxID=1802435 RepID=A0A1G2QAV0_9BACT|nr:MAG: preprotein translocase subunit SecE [Candidatus Vogelbacteria bacterium GWA1_51_14]